MQKAERPGRIRNDLLVELAPVLRKLFALFFNTITNTKNYTHALGKQVRLFQSSKMAIFKQSQTINPSAFFLLSWKFLRNYCSTYSSNHLTEALWSIAWIPKVKINDDKPQIFSSCEVCKLVDVNCSYLILFYIDFQKAFDKNSQSSSTFSSGRLAPEFWRSVCIPEAHKTYLTGGQQSVKTEKSLSTTLEVYSGVTQCSLLRALFVLIMINDMPECVMSQRYADANDSKVIGTKQLCSWNWHKQNLEIVWKMDAMNVELGEIELQRESAETRNPCAVTLSGTACLPPAGKKWTRTGKNC